VAAFRGRPGGGRLQVRIDADGAAPSSSVLTGQKCGPPTVELQLQVVPEAPTPTAADLGWWCLGLDRTASVELDLERSRRRSDDCLRSHECQEPGAPTSMESGSRRM
jgi:hypothetical protein